MNLIKFLNHLVCILIFIFQFGCSSNSMNESISNNKMDSSLKIKIEELKKSNDNSSIKCFVKLIEVIDEYKKSKIKLSGAKILTELKTILTIEGNSEAIKKVASFDFVHSISLSHNYKGFGSEK